MALGESAKVVWSNILYAPFINFAGGNVTGGYQVSQPLRGVWVQLVVVSRHVGFLAGGSDQMRLNSTTQTHGLASHDAAPLICDHRPENH